MSRPATGHRDGTACTITVSGPISGAVHVANHASDANAFTAWYLDASGCCDEYGDCDRDGATRDATGDDGTDRDDCDAADPGSESNGNHPRP